MYTVRQISWFFTDTNCEYCSGTNIYNFLNISANKVFKWLRKLRPCNTTYFPLWYWATLILAIIGLLINIQEMYRMYKGMEPTSIFRDHMYRFIPLHFRREVRVLSCVIMLNIYSLFIFGVVKMIPEHITPWIYTHGTALTMEMLLWLIDQCLGRDHFNINIFIEFGFVYMAWAMVCCVQETFVLTQTNGLFSLYQR